MATLREVRARITGVKKTQKITKAMKMVAAAKLRRAQSGVVAARPYARMLRAAVNHINTNYAQLYSDGKLKIFCVGRKSFDFFSKRHYKVAGKYIGIYSNLGFGQAQLIAREVIRGYLADEFDKVELVYNEFKSIAQQKIVIDQFLPLAPATVETASKGRHIHTVANYIHEPSSREIVDMLVPKHLNFQLWRVLLESNASEQGARMAAMDNATENANDLISSLQLVYNKARQASITKELLEIVSGAEALKKMG